MKVLIVDNDSLRALGLRRLLRDGHRAEVDTIGPGDVTSERLGGYMLIFVTPEGLSSNPDLFIAHKSHTVVVTTASSTFPTLDPTLAPEMLVNAIAGFVNDRELTDNHITARLSPRETDVLKLVAQGLINKEIADRLNISFNTVLTHRRNISTKLGIKSTSALGVYALINGLIEP